jgi:cytochrome c
MKIIFASMTVFIVWMMTSPAMAIDMPPLAKKNNCVACHAIDHKIVGPAWMDVSKRYKNETTYTYRGTQYPLFEGLVMKVSRGGSGNWGAMPMPGNAPAVKDEDIRELVKFVLGLAK